QTRQPGGVCQLVLYSTEDLATAHRTKRLFKYLTSVVHPARGRRIHRQHEAEPLGEYGFRYVSGDVFELSDLERDSLGLFRRQPLCYACCTLAPQRHAEDCGLLATGKRRRVQLAKLRGSFRARASELRSAHAQPSLSQPRTRRSATSGFSSTLAAACSRSICTGLAANDIWFAGFSITSGASTPSSAVM